MNNETTNVFKDCIKNLERKEYNEKLFTVALKYLDFWVHPDISLPNKRVRDYFGMDREEDVGFEHRTKYIVDDCFDSAELFLQEYEKRISKEV